MLNYERCNLIDTDSCSAWKKLKSHDIIETLNSAHPKRNIDKSTYISTAYYILITWWSSGLVHGFFCRSHVCVRIPYYNWVFQKELSHMSMWMRCLTALVIIE
ncbi:hypothetical protein Tsp_05525 [Trichinella spiralis]|uniref:hypothetical protein n=1 Tax=Trichinella spiralis TaxID=6334 RepID=UPI0001EFDBA7|nr:hypothetical protein Tsp_05525 [Trichinella spiralis]